MQDPQGEQHAEFIAEIHAQSHDETPRLIYADWLEENGDPRAEYLRLECELIGLEPGDVLYEELHPRFVKLRREMPEDWLGEIGRSRVMNCGESQCPKLWKRMDATSIGTIKICRTCRQPIQYYASVAAAAVNALRDQRVAIDKQYSDHHYYDVLRQQQQEQQQS